MTHPSMRGRGAAHNPPNRFDPISVEREEWTHAEDPAPETKFYRDATRSIIATNDSPDIGFDASVNPYRGCEHGCVWCMVGETPVLMADGTTRQLAELDVGDEVYGTVRRGWYRKYSRTRVLDRWETTKDAFRITIQDGTELVASGDHRFLTLRGWKFVTGTEWGRLRRPHLTTNDHLLGIGGFSACPPATVDYAVGYLCGIIRGDGHRGVHEYMRKDGKIGRLHQFRLAMVDDPALDRTSAYLRSFGVSTTPFVFQESTERTREIRAIRASSRPACETIEQLVAWRREPSTEWSMGFLAGIFDAEGSYSGGILRISNTDPVIIDAISLATRCLAFDIVHERVAKARSKPVTVVRLRGGLKEHLRFFHTVDPAILRKRNIEGQALKSQAKLRVVSIEPIGKRTLFDITTGTGDFIANGVVSHNCYARPTHEFFGLSAGLDFETKIFVKEDAPELLRQQLSSTKWEPRVLAMSGVTDPYQPVERRLEATRRCLEVLAEFRNPVSIITKNHLVTRDIDLLQRLALHDAAMVNLSVTTLRRSLQRVMEPRTSIPEKRFEAIRKLSGAGIPVGVLVAPVIPGLTDHEMPKILERAAEAGAVRAGWVMLRLPHAVKDLFEDWLGRHFPDRKAKVLNRLLSLRGGRLNDPRFGSRMRGEGPFAEQVRQVFEVSCRKAGLNRVPVELSTAAFRRPASEAEIPESEGSQLPLL
ncbi:MAG: PA0069 family radical SAM protein [Gemmatimonadota bacterium]